MLWEQSLHKLVAMGVDEAFEVGAGNVLAGFVKRTTPTIKMGVLDG